MFPGSYRPTAAHFFVALLAKKQLLLRNFTQNIDTLERVAAVSPELLVEAHGATLTNSLHRSASLRATHHSAAGSFGGAHCVSCGSSMSIDAVKTAIFDDQIPRCAACNGYVKPDIVFFGESLPKRYFELSMSDLPRADLLLVLGTSLKVQPFASLIDHVDDKCPRVLINREAVGLAAGDKDEDIFHFGSRGGFVFEGANAYRDVFLEGDVQESVRKLVELCGWTGDLQELIDAFDAKKKGGNNEEKTQDNKKSEASASTSASTTTASENKPVEESKAAAGAKAEKESEDDAEESKA
jgi:NAD-dependent deacetylase sirtuin 2